MTDARSKPKEAPQAVREIIRRAGHEIRNALNGVAINVEVVRSRSGREGSARDLASFADHASAQIREASVLADGLLAFVNAVLEAQSSGTLKTSGRGGEARIELMIYGDPAAGLVSDIERLASRIGVGVEEHDHRVILRILPEGKSYSKA